MSIGIHSVLACSGPFQFCPFHLHMAQPSSFHEILCPGARFEPLRSCVQVLEIMQTAMFCLVLPGDSASSRRTSEIFMSGCIPVFIGPPYATMPFGDAVDYKAAAYFFNITDHK